MFKKILVPLDFTEENQSALALAREMAARDGALILLLHVIETIHDVPFEEMRSFYERLEKRARTKLEEAAAGFAGAGAPVRQDVVYGRRAETIVSYAAEHGMDLILLSSHRASPERPASIGTISHKVAVLAHCPVLLVK
jgi:nucleotide-binding universal stress UspA family protein